MPKEIKAPIPGTFFRSSSPDQPPFKSAGDVVNEDDTIGLIEVMKSFHEIKAGIAGTALRFEVENEEPVMAGQVLLLLE